MRYLLLLVGAEIQENVQVLELPGGPLHNELLKGGHAEIHPRLGHTVLQSAGQKQKSAGGEQKQA